LCVLTSPELEGLSVFTRWEWLFPHHEAQISPGSMVIVNVLWGALYRRAMTLPTRATAEPTRIRIALTCWLPSVLSN